MAIECENNIHLYQISSIMQSAENRDICCSRYCSYFIPHRLPTIVEAKLMDLFTVRGAFNVKF